VLLTLPAQHESDDIANDRPRSNRPMPAWRCGDVNCHPPWRLEARYLPRLEPARIPAESPSAGRCRNDNAGSRQKRAAGVIEVVAVMIVGQQHRVDITDVRSSNRRTRELS
jgi:hypothetical protein